MCTRAGVRTPGGQFSVFLLLVKSTPMVLNFDWPPKVPGRRESVKRQKAGSQLTKYSVLTRSTLDVESMSPELTPTRSTRVFGLDRVLLYQIPKMIPRTYILYIYPKYQIPVSVKDSMYPTCTLLYQTPKMTPCNPSTNFRKVKKDSMHPNKLPSTAFLTFPK